MNQPPAPPPDTLDRLRRARLAGLLAAAVREASAALSVGVTTPAIAAEAARVFIAAGRPDAALHLYRLLAATRSPATQASAPVPDLEPEAVARLALLSGERELLAAVPVAEGAGWLARWQRDREDPCLEFEVRDLTVAVANGPVLYTVAGACPYCGQARAFDLLATLLVRVSGLCPACFGRYEVTYAGLRTFIHRRFPGLIDAARHAGDLALIEHVRRRLLEADDVPEIVRGLGQEYHFVLNEILAQRLMAAAAEPGDRP